MRAGMAAATGDVLVTVDADLSYGPEEIRKLYAHLKAHPECDLVIGSCWMPGGSVEGVPPFRAWVSRTGNWVLSHAFHGRFHTTTSLMRKEEDRASYLRSFQMAGVPSGAGPALQADRRRARSLPRWFGRGWRRRPVSVRRFCLTWVSWQHRGTLCRAVAFGLMVRGLLMILLGSTRLSGGWGASETALGSGDHCDGLHHGVWRGRGTLWLLIALESNRWRVMSGLRPAAIALSFTWFAWPACLVLGHASRTGPRASSRTGPHTSRTPLP